MKLKNLFYTLILALLFLQVSFLANAQIMGGESSGGRTDAQAVYVSFTSFGNGIDHSSLKLTEQLINDATINGNIITQTFEQRGHEGEVIYCVQLINAYKRYEFIKRLAPSILNDKNQLNQQRTFVYVGTNCDNIQNATEQDIAAYLK
ncbi:MAG: hypothetical protein A2381_06245 [Bdellovibrionales bacterium RIFOXYB1_FULL_37_110]|nr:MAG: hypothetical protein A2417_02520 [Bdellovibrionales bacterium RIFOXYC1_FULL_37_79]OFZ60105.1 MAG: hypothetical protein A2381_06245 [Bdellovibrionales bacterium RIFOXYB1_FULL_37_110]OFZ63432.1 MAG: hypothetical protein A2577_00040 [Bdellovibrionales bacterium RIFOXYD1_FULL_36_51]